jgi:hypothetical protein
MLNLVPLALTWRAFESDGIERIGFPLIVFERGGFSYYERFHPENLASNTVLMMFAAYVLAEAVPTSWWPRQFSLLAMLTMAAVVAILAAWLSAP